MREAISPRILPANFTSGKSAIGYEFCYPSVVARQLGFVQVPPLFYFADKVQARNPIGTALTYNRLKNLEPVVDMTQLADWQVASLTTIPFTQWWSEWQDHLFCGSLKVYCIALDENYQGVDDEVNTEQIPLVAFSYYTVFLYSDKSSYQANGTPPPTVSRSGQPIRYVPPTDYPLIGYNAPTLADMAAGKKQKVTSTKKTIQKTPGSFSRTLTIASAPNADVPADATPPRT